VTAERTSAWPHVVLAQGDQAEGPPLLDAATIAEHGAVLFRGFDVATPEAFRATVTPLLGHLLTYAGGVGFKSVRLPGIYASTELPRWMQISAHSELAYTRRPPRFVAFWCETPSPTGGQTTLACARRVFQSLSETTRTAFLEQGIQYHRAYPDRGALVRALNRLSPMWPSWQRVFETDDRQEVERIALDLGMVVRWTPGGAFRATHTLSAVNHDAQGNPVWVNHAHTFLPSVAGLGWLGFLATRLLGWLPPFRQAWACFGSGEPIPRSMIEEISTVIRAQSDGVAWQRGDLLVLDNARTLHGRLPYSGPRKVWAAMGHGRTA